MATAKTTAKTTAKKAKQEVATTAEQLPEWLKGKMDDDRGSENVEAEDLVIPRLELVQALSKCRKKSDPAYIEGCEEGMLYNNLTRELYGESVTLVPVFFKKEWLLWRDQEEGGGFAGAHPSLSDAERERQNQEEPEEWESIETHQHFCLLVRQDGTTEEVVVSMAKSKMKKSKQWNSLIRINGGPRFSRMYKYEGVPAVNDKNQDYYNVEVKNEGFVTQEIFEHAEKTYGSISSGKAKADYSFDGQGDDPDEESGL